MNIPKISALFETSLASSLSAAGSSFTVVSGTDRDGNALSGLYGFIIDEGSADEEFVIGTISSTTVTITYRGIDADAPNTEVAGNKKAHRRGASVKITDYPILGVIRNILNGDETVPNKLGYASHPTFSATTDIVDKKYVDDTNNTGAADASTTVQGLVEEATQAEVEAGTDVGATGAKLFVPASKNGAKLYYGYAADGGANDTYTATLSPVPTAYTTGMVCVIKFNTINTGAATINLNGLGAKDIRKNNGLVLSDGDIAAGQFHTLVYNGTYMELQSPLGKAQVSQSGSEIYAADSVGTDTYAISLSPGPLAIVTGMVVRAKIGTANTGAATLSVNGSSAYAIKKNYNSDLVTGDLLANQIIEVVFDGTNWQLLSVTNTLGNKVSIITTNVVVANTTTETDLISVSIPANTLQTNDAVKARLYISSFVNNVSTYGATIRLKYGATTVVTLTLSASAISTDIGGYLDVLLLASGATNTQEASMGIQLRASATTTTNSATYPNYLQYFGAGTAAEDSTGALTLKVTFQWAQADAGNTVTMAQAIVEKIN